ncbi:MAG: hypothetical protein DIJKHBIC_02307 [Thermoanaerobaculia bacterium]|nr:hypothetical protein [Thermoanaerobaculia bacterium]
MNFDPNPDLVVPIFGDLGDYFDVQRPDDIRIKGHRIGIETVLYDYIYRAWTPEEIARYWETLTLEEVYATILFYHRHRDFVTAYLADGLEFSRKFAEEQRKQPPTGLPSLRERVASDPVKAAHYEAVMERLTGERRTFAEWGELHDVPPLVEEARKLREQISPGESASEMIHGARRDAGRE